MPALGPVGFILSLFLFALSGVMLVPALYDWQAGNAEASGFLTSAVVTAGVAGLLFFSTRGCALRLSVREAFLLTAVSWVVTGLFAALPFIFAVPSLAPADAVFEAISGLTTTGSSILADIEALPPGLLLWRSLLQWVGGIGIIAMAVAMLPFLGVGGMQLFHAESSDRSEKVLPRARQIVTMIGLVYLALTALCTLAFFAADMNGFDAINHAMTTISTGGYSTRNASFGAFSPLLQWIAIVFMIAGALPFVLYVRAVRGAPEPLFRDEQVRSYLGLFLVVAAALTIFLRLTWPISESSGETLTKVVFNLVSVLTTTGFASDDFNAWGGFAVGLFFILYFVGGCTGSTSGGIKIYRLLILGRFARVQMARLLLPRQIHLLRFNDQRVSSEVVDSIVAFLALFLASFLVLGLALALMGLDLTTAFSASATALGNVGPGLGEIVGPAGNFSTLPDAAKWLLSLGMLLGRLEIFTLLVLLTPGFWRS